MVPADLLIGMVGARESGLPPSRLTLCVFVCVVGGQRKEVAMVTTTRIDSRVGLFVLIALVLVTILSLVITGDGGANTPELIMPNGICPPTC